MHLIRPVELSHLTKPEQKMVLSAMEDHGIKPSHKQALELKKLKQAGNLTADTIATILSENKNYIKADSGIGQYRKFFPEGFTIEEMDSVITGLLQGWQSTNNTARQSA